MSESSKDPRTLIDPGELQGLRAVAECAKNLHDWLYANAGIGPEYLVDIVAAEDSVETLVTKLNNLRDSLAQLQNKDEDP